MKFKATLAIVLCSALVASAADLRVPADLISQDTAAVIDLNIDQLKRPLFLQSVTDILGEQPSQEMQCHYDDFMRKFAAAGGATVSIVVNVLPDSNYSTEGLILVIGPRSSADIPALSDYMFSFAPEMKENFASECPVTIGGSLVWYQRFYTLPEPSAVRYAAFASAYQQLPKNQSFTAVLRADNPARGLVRGSLKPMDADRVESLMQGNGICIFTDLGAVEKPTLHALLLKQDAAGTEKSLAIASALFVDLKKKLPESYSHALDSLTLLALGSNLRISIALPTENSIVEPGKKVASGADTLPAK
jgi:hypothetical protein